MTLTRRPPPRQTLLQFFCLFALTSWALPGNSIGVPLLQADYLGFPVHPKPRCLTVGDLSGDGMDDLVAIDSDGLAVLIAHGDGTLEAQRRVDSGSVIAVAVADLNGDRIKDLAALRTDDAFLHIFPGRGDGNFGAPFSVPFVINGGDLLARDLNGDGQPDLAATDPTGSTVWVWISGRGGNLGAPRVYPIPTQPDHLLAGDVDGDGRPELLVLHRYQAGFTSLANDGLGNFASPTLHVAPSGSSLAATGDVNGDGRADLIIPEGYAYDRPYALNTWYGRPDGSFDPPVRVETGALAEGLAVGDLDADGAEDVIVIRSRAFLVHKGSPSGLGPAGPPRFVSPAGAPAALGNFDGDRRLDLCVPEWSATGGIPECPLYSGSTLFVFKGLGDGGFARLAGLVAIARAENVETTDFDQDGRPDLVVTTQLPSAITVLHGIDGGGFELLDPIPVAGEITSLKVVDIDQDGRAELVATVSPDGFSFGELDIFDLDAQGALRLRAHPAVGAFPFDFTSADFDGDGKLDFAVANLNGTSVTVLLAGPDGPLSVRKDVPSMYRPSSVAAWDFDRDGRSDLLVGTGGPHDGYPALFLLRGAGDGSFDVERPLLTRFPVHALAIGEVRGHGDITVVAAESRFGCPDERYGVSVYHADSGFLIPSQGPLFMGGTPGGVRLADLTGDGRLDLVTAGDRGRVDVRPAMPDGSFGEREEFGVPGRAWGLALADFDRDGRSDVVVSTEAGVYSLRNLGGATVDSSEVAARIGDGLPDAILARGKTGALTLTMAGDSRLDVSQVDLPSVRLAGARALSGREHVQDTVSRVRVPLEACRLVEDQPDGRPDLELEFSAGDVLAGWLASREFLRRDPPEAEAALLPFEGRLRDGSRISGHACALIVGRPEVRDARAIATLSAFGPWPGRDYGVGVVLDLPAPAASADVTIYDVAGRRVAELHRGGLDAGFHRLTWSGGPGSIAAPTSGIYFARAMVDGERLRARVLVLR